MTLTTRDIIPALVAEHRHIFQCPACGGALEIPDDGTHLACSGCGRAFGCKGGIPRLFWPNEWTEKADVTEIVRAFYEETPFPNYDDFDSAEQLRVKAQAGVFASLLDNQLRHGWRILEIGCGTGQLSNFLALTWGRTVFGTDLCLNSLALAEAFRERNEIAGVRFLQMNLFRPAFRPESFDVVVCNGVLHHTSDPFQGFQSILRCVKRGGFIIVGLYNRYGRLTTALRRAIFRVTGDRWTCPDPWLRRQPLSIAKRRAWFMDQYKHPHESKHTIGEVLQWFDRLGVEFIKSIPKCAASETFAPDERLFEPHPRRTALDHFVMQSRMLLTGGREGGFFVMIGRKHA